jgi:1,4-alpha-glucan branching enzyme
LYFLLLKSLAPIRLVGECFSVAKPSKDLQKQTFRFTAPGATSVLLVGDFTRWQQQAIPMRQDKSGICTTTVELAPGKHTYRFLVDGEWRDDPECTLRAPNAFGSQDMIREAA